jgi:hypothetical protein
VGVVVVGAFGFTEQRGTNEPRGRVHSEGKAVIPRPARNLTNRIAVLGRCVQLLEGNCVKPEEVGGNYPVPQVERMTILCNDSSEELPEISLKRPDRKPLWVSESLISAHPLVCERIKICGGESAKPAASVFVGFLNSRS